LKYILRGNNDLTSPIDTVLKNRQVDKSLFNLDERVVEDYNNYDNMQLGVETLLKHINEGNKIIVIPDVDVDGLTSSAMLYRYIRDVLKYKNIEYIMHTEKIHGLSEDIYIPEDVKLILLPDASSNDYEQHKYYKNKGVDIIVTDHHPASHLSEDAIVINNRLSKKVKNENLSGAGVTYKFLKALDDYLFENKADYFLDLLSVGNIADMMDLKEEETRYLCYRGIKEINNTFLKALIEKNSFDLDGKYNIDKIGWVIAPKLNGTIRSGTQEVKENMFKAFILDDYEFGLEIADKCKSAKSTQDSSVKTALPKIEKNIKINNEDRCILIEVSNTLKSAHTGLVANKLQEKYGVPVLLYRKEKDGIIGGNARGNSNITTDFKADLTNSGLFETCEGQPNAFGWTIKKENLDKVNKYLNELYQNKEIINGKTYEVDFILNGNNFDENIVHELSQYEDEWGNGLNAPLIVFQNIDLNLDESNLKGKLNIVFYINNIKFIKKFATNVLKGEIINKSVKVDIVGKCTVDTYHNCGQIEVVDIEII
jgi:single-stranded-DNA-specific exonuclease